MRPVRKLQPGDIDKELQVAEGPQTDNVVPIRRNLEEERRKLEEEKRQKELDDLEEDRKYQEAILRAHTTLEGPHYDKVVKNARSKLHQITQDIEHLEKDN
jgi:hypothetical protein